MSNDSSKCSSCGSNSCRCWELDAAKYNHKDIAGQIRLEELRDQHYGIGRNSR
jgi:hypothetical protein